MSQLQLAHEISWQEPLKLFNLFAHKSGAIFLDSAQQMPGYGQYSFIGLDPFLTLSSKGTHIQLDKQTLSGDPFAVLKQQLLQFPLARVPNLPPFQGGVAGYWSYDGDMVLGFYDLVIAFDLAQKRAWIFSSGYPEQNLELRRTRAQSRLDELLKQLEQPSELPSFAKSITSAENIKSNFSENSYQQAVQHVIDYILAGDIFQANIAQCFTAAKPDDCNPFDLYLRLRKINPALFSAFVNTGDLALASASPERFLKLTDKQVTSCPIKGTRPRGNTPAQDEIYKNELAISSKDRAENIMIVDLLRNDLSKVCADHSVEVPILCGLESFATVHHLVSVVSGRLKPEHDAVDLLQAAFPGGSITGAPKVRAMEIIAEIENKPRGPYCGSIGYIGFDGDMDSSIVIRTFVIDNESISFHAGGGITADSNPQQEYEETLAKARALTEALTR
jgi:para-aminobenzoate synthetase component 1